MKELSLNILDITMNSVKAGADSIYIQLSETKEKLTFSVTDNGCGMTKELLERVADPFCTSRTTRRVGLGIPFLKLAAEQTGGFVEISSRAECEYPKDHGTVITAHFYKNHIDCLPLGDITSTVCTLIQGSPDIDFVYKHKFENGAEVNLSTKELRKVLGEVTLDTPEVVLWIRGYLEEQYELTLKK